MVLPNTSVDNRLDHQIFDFLNWNKEVWLKQWLSQFIGYLSQYGHFIAMILINHRIFRYPIFRQSHIWENSMGIFARNERSCGNAYAINLAFCRIGLYDF